MEFLQTLTRNINAKGDRNRTCLGQVRLTYMFAPLCMLYL
jgi:anthranilate phosphoribosyltransferase